MKVNQGLINSVELEGFLPQIGITIEFGTQKTDQIVTIKFTTSKSLKPNSMNTVTKHGWRTEIHDYGPNGGFVRWENHRTFYGGFSSKPWSWWHHRVYCLCSSLNPETGHFNSTFSEGGFMTIPEFTGESHHYQKSLNIINQSNIF